MHRDRPADLALTDTPTNEYLANKIQKEWLFKMKRAPGKIVIRYGIVMIVLTLLQTLLIISNNVHYLGYWKSFTKVSSQCRDAYKQTRIARAAHFDSTSLDPYHLWRGWIAPSFLTGSTYIVTTIFASRIVPLEAGATRALIWGDESIETRAIHTATLAGPFLSYLYRQAPGIAAKHIQKQKHVALENSKEFLKVLRTVSFNILISVIAALFLWISLLQTKIEACDIVQLPRSYVPPTQGIV